MADRVVRILEQDKQILRGLKPRGKHAVLSLDDNETLNITFNWSDWLGSDTIASVTNAAIGATISGASNTTTTATFKVSATSSGWIEHRITTVGGLVKEKLIFVEVNSAPVNPDYGFVWRPL